MIAVLYAGSVLLILIVGWLAVRAGRMEAKADLERRRQYLADERRARAQLNGHAPLETRAASRTPPRLPRR